MLRNRQPAGNLLKLSDHRPAVLQNCLPVGNLLKLLDRRQAVLRKRLPVGNRLHLSQRSKSLRLPSQAQPNPTPAAAGQHDQTFRPEVSRPHLLFKSHFKFNFMHTKVHFSIFLANKQLKPCSMIWNGVVSEFSFFFLSRRQQPSHHPSQQLRRQQPTCHPSRLYLLRRIPPPFLW